MIKRQVNDGIVQITLDDSRWYFDDKGKPYASTTWINEYYFKDKRFYQYLAGLPSWDEAQTILNNAGDQGSRVHWGMEQLVSGLPIRHDAIPYGYNDPFTLREWRLIMCGANWIQQYKPIILSIEETILGDGYGGTMDLTCLIDDGLIDGNYRENEDTGRMKMFYEPTGKMSRWVIDWKTSAAIYTTHELQQAAYWRAADGQIDRCGIVRLGSNHKAGFEFKEILELEKKFKVFEHVKAIWAFENPNPHPRFVEVPEQIHITDLQTEEQEDVTS